MRWFNFRDSISMSKKDDTCAFQGPKTIQEQHQYFADGYTVL